MCDIFKSFNASFFFLVLKGEYLLHKVGNKGERGGEGTDPSGTRVVGPRGDGGDGEVARGWPQGRLAQGGGYCVPTCQWPCLPGRWC